MSDNNTTNNLHVVLGGSGAIGQAVLKELARRNIPAVAVERSKQVPGVETRKADLLNLKAARESMKGASHVYLCVGLPYQTKVWEQDWPTVMENIITACSEINAKLIFLDNIYMYGPAPLAVPILETHGQSPTTRKGKLRKRIADMLFSAHAEGKVKMVIGRSADFYGPSAVWSILYVTVLKRMLEAKDPQWLGKKNATHTYAFTEDNGRALVTLALDDGAYGQIFHLPVSHPLTIEEVVAEMNTALGTSRKVAYLPRPLLNILSLFIPILAEVGEVVYQFDTKYVLSDSKFKTRYPEFKTTPFSEGVRAMIASFK